jgi:hypothetical protein
MRRRAVVYQLQLALLECRRHLKEGQCCSLLLSMIADLGLHLLAVSTQKLRNRDYILR